MDALHFKSSISPGSALTNRQCPAFDVPMSEYRVAWAGGAISVSLRRKNGDADIIVDTITCNRESGEIRLRSSDQTLMIGPIANPGPKAVDIEVDAALRVHVEGSAA